MSATAAPFGLRPVGNLSGTYNGSFRQYPILSTYSTGIAFGDVVKLVDNTSTTTIEKDTGTSSATPIGIFLGCRYTDLSTKQTQFNQQWTGTAHTNGMAYVCDDPNVLFEIQADGAPTNAGDIYGKNTLLVQTAPNTSLKVSRVALDISELSTDAQNPIRVIDYKGGNEGDEKGTSFPILVCKFNYHQHSSATGSA